MDKILYNIIYAGAWLRAIFPLEFLYVIADVIYYPLYYIIRYRRKLVRKNLTNAFPDKAVKEIIRIEKQFYRHFCDYLFETVKLLHISDAEMKRRFVFKNIELLESLMKDGNSCLMMLGHYGNWEWVTSITLWYQDENAVIGQIYRPLKNKAFDRFFFNLRKRFHSLGITKNDTLREIVKIRKSKKKILMGFISDQKPSASHIYYWTPFLNQDTPMLTGTERIACQTGFSVVYLDVTKKQRGYYEGEIKLITADPKSTTAFEITEKYTRMLEETILRQPAYWLWTHNRWKYKREQST